MSLYTVYFTSRHIVSKYNDKGVKIGDYTTDISQTITALPHVTAMQYKSCDNFRIEPYQIDASGRSAPASTWKSGHRTEKAAAPAAKKSSTNSVKSAAATGDLAAAISKGE